MIDTKIACQCGNRFKFGMDLVNGRAPDGLVCPTCGAPATPACNALVDFLSGQEPPPPSAGSRPLKEIRVTCACGARYKFDLELAEREMPGPVICPGCQADLTQAANEEIRGYVAKHPLELAAAPAAPAPATAATTAAEPVPPSPAAPAPVPAASAASSILPPPPAPLTAQEPAPPATSAAPAAPVATPVSDPFGPPPPGKSSGPNLKPLEVPKPNRPPPGSRPAAPPPSAKPPGSPTGASAGTATAKAGKPDPAKPAAKPTAKPARREQSLGLGVAGAFAGAVIGAALWFAVLKSTGRPSGFMALAVGVLAGFGARILGRGGSTALGGATCVASVLVIVTMVWTALMRQVDSKLEPQLALQYKAAVDRAQAVVNAQTDAELKPFVLQTMPVADSDSAQVSEEAIRNFRATKVPEMRAFLTDKDARAKFESRQRALFRSAYPLEETWEESFGILGLLWLLGGFLAAAKIAMK